MTKEKLNRAVSLYRQIEFIDSVLQPNIKHHGWVKVKLYNMVDKAVYPEIFSTWKEMMMDNMAIVVTISNKHQVKLKAIRDRLQKEVKKL